MRLYTEVSYAISGRPDGSHARIHWRIAEAAAQSHLAPMLERIVDNPLVVRAYRSFDRSELARSVLFHRLIVEATRRGAGDRAGRLIREHVLQARHFLIAQVRGSDAR